MACLQASKRNFGVRTLKSTSGRPGEVGGLTWDNINWDSHFRCAIIDVLQTKTCYVGIGYPAVKIHVFFYGRLFSGKHAFFMASPERDVCDEWIATFQTALAILYQKSPVFSQEFLRIHLMDGTFTTMPMTEFTKTRDVIRFMCKKHGLLSGNLDHSYNPHRD